VPGYKRHLKKRTALQIVNIPWLGAKIFKGVGGEGQKYIKYNKIKINSENFRGEQDCYQGVSLPCLFFVAGLKTNTVEHKNF